MIPLLFVGDGLRDGAMGPPIVSTILARPVSAEIRPWARLHEAGHGYQRKLRFAVAEAQDANLSGVVATVDADRTGRERLRALEEARASDRNQATAFPVALGCADPHAEAWLLDDPTAIKQVLGLAADSSIGSVRKIKNPKAELERLIKESRRAGEASHSLMAEIATALDPGRCVHGAETGFAGFRDDILAELGGL